jgi:hypothetical protein
LRRVVVVVLGLVVLVVVVDVVDVVVVVVVVVVGVVIRSSSAALGMNPAAFGEPWSTASPNGVTDPSAAATQ